MPEYSPEEHLQDQLEGPLEDEGLSEMDPDSPAPPTDEDLDAEQDPNEPESDLIGGRFASQEDLLNAYANLEQMIGAERSAYRDVRGRLEGLEDVLRTQQLRESDEVFSEQLREQFDKDPLETMQMMILESKKQHWDAMEQRLSGFSEAFQQSQAGNVGAQSLKEVLDDPRHAGLRPYAGQLEHLVTERGMRPDEAFDLLHSVEDSLIANFDRRTAAARDVRNSSTVESVGGSDDAGNSDGDLDRVLKKSKTLDEMFDGLSRIKL